MDPLDTPRPLLVVAALRGYADLLECMGLAGVVPEEAHAVTIDLVATRLRGLAAAIRWLDGIRGPWPAAVFAEVGFLTETLERLVRLSACRNPHAHADLVLITTGLARLADAMARLLGSPPGSSSGGTRAGVGRP
jgi:hypothetical protein